jgi:hypothetical protein
VGRKEEKGRKRGQVWFCGKKKGRKRVRFGFAAIKT